MKGWFWAGLLGALLVVPAERDARAADKEGQPRVRTYYIAADEVQWNYLPSQPLNVLRGDNEINGAPPPKTDTYTKVVYREYTSDSFTTLKPRPPEWEHLGILGPVIRAEVGDVIKVVFKNNSRLICSMHPHGLQYDEYSEGAYYGKGVDVPPNPKVDGDAVKKGEVVTYIWNVPERSGPGPMDPSSILWMYHSHFNESRDMNSGLLGPIIISRKGSTKPDGMPKDVDREFVVAFAVFQESSSGFFMMNIVHDQQYPASAIKDPNFQKTLEYYTLNGYIRGTLPMLTMKKGERVRWYLMGNSNEDDTHVPHWHGQTVLVNQMRMDTVNMGPMGMMVADMVPDNPGTWLMHCHVNDHYDGGMYSLFKVLP